MSKWNWIYLFSFVSSGFTDFFFFFFVRGPTNTNKLRTKTEQINFIGQCLPKAVTTFNLQYNQRHMVQTQNGTNERMSFCPWKWKYTLFNYVSNHFWSYGLRQEVLETIVELYASYIKNAPSIHLSHILPVPASCIFSWQSLQCCSLILWTPQPHSSPLAPLH